MAIQTKDVLKSYFTTGQIITQEHLADLVDTLLALVNSNNITIYPSGNVGINEATDSGNTFSVTGTSAFSDSSEFNNGIYTTLLYDNGKSGNPTFSLGGGGDGSGATANVSGTDMAGLIAVNTGRDCLAGKPIIGIEFAKSYPNGRPPIVILTPVGPTNAVLAVTQIPYIDRISEQGFVIAANPRAAIADSTKYYWNYLVIGVQ